MTINVEKFFIDNSDRTIYDKLEKELQIKKINKKDLFMFALATGNKNNCYSPLEKKLEFFWSNVLRPEDEIILKSIALKNCNNFEILQNHEDMARIVQEFAHGGISIIKEKFTQHGSFLKQIEKEIEEEYTKVGI